MRFLSERDVTIPLLHVQVSFPAGALADPPGKEGTTRLLLRLLRRTAGQRSTEENQALLDAMGASAHAEVGRTHASLSGTAISRSTPALLDFLSAALSDPRWEASEVDKLKREAQAEAIESLDDDAGLVRAFFSRAFFEEHPLGRPAQGTQQSLARVELPDLRARYDALLGTPPVLSFAGDAEPESIAEFGAALERGPLKTPAGDTARVAEPGGPRGRRLLFVDKPERTQTQILMGCLGTHPKDDDHIALYLGHMIFGGTFTARLSQEVRAKRGWSYGAYSSLPIGLHRQAFTLWTFPAKENAADCVSLCIELLDRLLTRGVTKKELSLMKRFVINSHAFSVDTAAKRVGQALDAALYDLPTGYHETFCDKVKATSVEEVNSALRNRLSLDHLLTTVVGTAEDVLEQVSRACQASDVRRVPFDRPD